MTLGILALVTINDVLTIYTYRETMGPVYSLVTLAFGLFLLFNTLGNMYRAMSVDSSLNAIDVQIKQLPEWRFCSSCELYAPPRSFHCFTCNKCILKRHNHCLFLGKCVGHNNHRFYLLFIMYVWLGALYSTILNRQEYFGSFHETNLKSIVLTFMPLIAWCFGFMSLKQFVFVFTNSVCFILSMLMFVYFLINLKMVLKGQTWHENAKDVRSYDINWKYNLKEVIGQRWLSALLCPFTSSRLHHNGTNFKRKSALNNDHSQIDNSPFEVPKRRII